MKFFAWPLGLWLAARRSVRGSAPRRRGSARASLAPRPALHAARRVRPRPAPASAGASTRTRTRSSASWCRRAARSSLDGSRRSPRERRSSPPRGGSAASPWPSPPRSSSRRSSGSTTSRSRRCRSPSAARGCRRSGSCRSRRGGCRAPDIGIGDTGGLAAGADRLRGRVRGRVPRRARAQGSRTAPIAPRVRLAHEGRGRARRVGARVRRAPVVVAVWMFVVAHPDRSRSTSTTSSTPRRELLLDWENPFPPDGRRPLAAGTTSSGRRSRRPRRAADRHLPLEAADWAIALVGLACCMASLRIVGVRDWRVYGVFALWPQVIGEIRVSHLTPFLCLLLALAWRYRDDALRARARDRPRGRDQVLPLAARRLARRDRPRARGGRRGRRRRRVAPPRPPVHEPRRLPRGRWSSSGGHSTTTATRRSASWCRPGRRRRCARAATLAARRVAARRRAGDARASRSPSPPRSCSRRSSGSTTTPRRGAARRRPAAALAGLARPARHLGA